MKKRSILPLFTDYFLAVLLCGGSIGCLVSGFDLHVEPSRLFYGAVLWPLAGVVCARLRRGGLIAAALGLVWGLFCKLDCLAESLKNLVYLVGRLLYQAYEFDWEGIFAALDPDIFQADVGLAVEFVTLLVGVTAGMTVGRQKSAWLCLPGALLPVALTLMVQDTVPDNPWIFGLFLAVSLLLLTNSTRCRDAFQGGKLTVALLVPLALCVGWLLDSNPRESFRPLDLENGILAFLQERADKLPYVDVDENGNLTITGDGGSRVNLSMLGPKTQSQLMALEVTTGMTGDLYLRGRSFSDYTGTRWVNYNSPKAEYFTVSGEYLAIRAGSSSVSPFPNDTVTIQTRANRPLCYVPYYPAGGSAVLKEGQMPNGNEDAVYSYAINPLDPRWKDIWMRSHAYDRNLTIGTFDVRGMEPFLELPQDTLEWAQPMVMETVGVKQNMYAFEAAEIISDYVKGIARYSLNTSRMPWGRQDFAQWFLTQAETGYCVHFATAATVLLRAAGIPARYVEGYAVHIPEDVDIPGGVMPLEYGIHQIRITESMAHAWVEYYMPEVGWVMLEATPAGGVLTHGEQEPSTGTTAPSTTASTEASTRPSSTVPSSGTTAPETTGTAPVATQPREDPIPRGVWMAAAWIALGFFGIVGQWQLRLWLRRKLLTRGTTNQQALRRWRYALYTGKLLGKKPPSQLHQLAQKAKFSPHTITPEELSQFDEWFAKHIRLIRKRNILVRAWYRLVLAMY